MPLTYAPHPDQFPPYNSVLFTNLMTLLSLAYYAPMLIPMPTQMPTHINIKAIIDAHINADISRFFNIVRLFTNRGTETYRVLVLSRSVIIVTTFLWNGGYTMEG
ncbi:hypothetical protein J1N35_024649 [Gossypium stocksii]|uniref:Uncharacterized protein n=1 Tax=Gossypium stocksii TaxID=47602 RepID=A0A9D3V611_9ROSI|nr:hypothetical protein J1N35_024649 [Gossypium stocksii]